MSEKPFVLVTGGTGFLGSHLVGQLLDAGYRVRCTARPLKARFLEDAHFQRGSQFEVMEIEDLATDDLAFALRDIDAVIHTAFPVPDSQESTELLMNGVQSTTHLLRQAYEYGIRKFVVTSSYLAVVGGDPNSVWRDYTFSDKDWNDATYDAVFEGTKDPAWVYAAAKKLAEAAAWDFVRSHPGIDLATVLPTLLIGPFAPGHAILSTGDLSTNILLHSLITSRSSPRPVWPNFVDVRDAAAAHIQALEALLVVKSAHPSEASTSGSLTNPVDISNLTLSDTGAFPSPTTSLPPTPISAESSIPRRLIASGASFTWKEAISHLHAVRPEIRLPDESTCVPLPRHVARLTTIWSGAEKEKSWGGIKLNWRDWRETVVDAVADIERVSVRLEQSGWEDLFDGDEDAG